MQYKISMAGDQSKLSRDNDFNNAKEPLSVCTNISSKRHCNTPQRATGGSRATGWTALLYHVHQGLPLRGSRAKNGWGGAMALLNNFF